MEIITLTLKNLNKEHICCAISNNDDLQVKSKKSWLAERLTDGLVFKKGNVRGKCFIEYIPAEKAWVPVVAPNYMYINCLWVAGQFQGHGYANLLLESCIQDSRAKHKQGLAILSSVKKKPFLADPKFLAHKGFKVADTINHDYELRYLPFEDSASPVLRFADCLRQPPKLAEGFVLYYSHQCPFTAKYVPLLAEMAQTHNLPLQVIQLTTTEEAQQAPTPCTSYSLFYNGKFLTNEILSTAKFLKIAAQQGLSV